MKRYFPWFIRVFYPYLLHATATDHETSVSREFRRECSRILSYFLIGIFSWFGSEYSIQMSYSCLVFKLKAIRRVAKIPS